MSKDTPAAVDQAAIDAARAEGHAEGVKAGHTAAVARISAILDSEEAKGNPKLAAHLAFQTDMPADAAKAAILAAGPAAAATQPGNEAAKQFQAAVEEGAPKVAAGGSDEGQQPSRAQRVIAMRGWNKKKAD